MSQPTISLVIGSLVTVKSLTQLSWMTIAGTYQPSYFFVSKTTLVLQALMINLLVVHTVCNLCLCVSFSWYYWCMRDDVLARRRVSATTCLRDDVFARRSICATIHLRNDVFAWWSVCAMTRFRVFVMTRLRDNGFAWWRVCATMGLHDDQRSAILISSIVYHDSISW
jgi:hypothetical protein